MIQPFLFALILFPAVPVLHRVGIGRVGAHRAVFAMFLALGGYFVLWILSCGIFSLFELRGFLGGLGLVGFLGLSYIEFFSMLCRGFSLTILVDLEEKSAQTEDELIVNYGGGKSADWLIAKRLGSLQKLGWVDWNESSLWLANRTAYLIGRLGAIFKNTLRLSEGG